jgi:hypothetical protein
MLVQPDTMHEHLTSHENVCISFALVHLLCLLKTRHVPGLNVFMRLMKNPSNYADSYLPSMPHDDDYEAFQAYKNTTKDPFKYYSCSNGHFYTIGDCTRPNAVSKCPTCKEEIGGSNHVLAPGNKQSDVLMERVEKGYCFIKDNSTLDSIRNMGFLNTCLLRFMLNATLYLASILRNENNQINTSIQQLITANLNLSSPLSEFFYKQLVNDIKMLSNSLQNSTDESLLLLNYIMCRLCDDQTLSTTQGDYNVELKTKQDRKKYEEHFCQRLIDPILNNDVEKLLPQLTTKVMNDSGQTNSDELFRIAYELIEQDDLRKIENYDPKLDQLNEPKYWSFRKQANLETMLNSFNLSINSANSKSQFALLSRFLVKMNELQALKYLPSLTKMISKLHARFNRQLSKQQAGSIIVSDLVDSNHIYLDKSLKELVQVGSQSFLKAWTLMHQHIDMKFTTNGSNFNDPILFSDDQLPLSYLLMSSSSKQARYIYALVFYLINMQNEFLKFYADYKAECKTNELANYDEPIEMVRFEDFGVNNCISFSPNKEILQIVYMYSNYSLVTGKNINLEYDFVKIQNSIDKSILAGRSFIESKVNKVIYSYS